MPPIVRVLILLSALSLQVSTARAISATSSHSGQQDSATQDATLTTRPPDKDKPSVAGWGFFPTYPKEWQGRHSAFLERTKAGKTEKGERINVVFLGDSITQGWNDAGKSVWEQQYAPLGAVNYGIGGDTTRQVLWRIAHGELDFEKDPKLVVLKIGTNNLYNDHNSGTDEEIAEGVTTIVTTIRKKLPKTKILLLGVLPRENDYFCNRITHLNTIIAKLDNGKTVRFLDMSAKFLEAPNKVKPSLFNPDRLHLVTAGYEMWADTMKPLFTAMLGKPETKKESPKPKKRVRKKK